MNWASASVRGSNVDRVCLELWDSDEGKVYFLFWEGSVLGYKVLVSIGLVLIFVGSDVALGSVATGSEELNRSSLKFGGLTQTGFGLEFGVLM